MGNLYTLPKFTRHAEKRWLERCPGLDKQQQWDAAKKLSKKIRQLLRKTCPAHLELTTRTFKGFYYLYVQASKLIFVIEMKNKKDKIVTVLRY